VIPPTVPETEEHVLYIGLAKSGKLYESKSDDESRTMSKNATSFSIASGFVIFTTTLHEVVFAPIALLPKLFEQTDVAAPKEIPPDWATRKVERGSRIVVAVPSSMSLVLQMPRGNLETINPRPLVMEVVKQDLDAYVFLSPFSALLPSHLFLDTVEITAKRFLLAANIVSTSMSSLTTIVRRSRREFQRLWNKFLKSNI
jgi:elongator complex protein 1